MIDNTSTPKIYQDDPELGDKRSNGWKTTYGYFNESKRLARSILHNAKITPYEATISFMDHLTIEEHRTLWAKICRTLRSKGLEAVWVREPQTNNQIHYHLLISSSQTTKLDILSGMPTTHKARVHFAPVKDQLAVAYYIAKAKIAGPATRDRWVDKRLLFADNITLAKFGTIGNFWTKPKKQLWKEIIEEERQIANYKDEVYEEAREVYNLLDGYISRTKLTRLFAIHAMKAAQMRDISGEN